MTSSPNYPLWLHLVEEHELTLLESELLAAKFARLASPACRMIDAARSTILIFDLPSGHVLSSGLAEFDAAFDAVDEAVENMPAPVCECAKMAEAKAVYSTADGILDEFIRLHVGNVIHCPWCGRKVKGN